MNRQIAFVGLIKLKQFVLLWVVFALTRRGNGAAWAWRRVSARTARSGRGM